MVVKSAMSDLEFARVVVLEAILKERELQDAVWENQEEYSDSWWHVIVTEKNVPYIVLEK